MMMEMMLEKKFEAHGLECAVLRNGAMGHLCGYVSLPKEHPWYGMRYGKIEKLDNCPTVHGGITYSENKLPCSDSEDGWWLGFDCAHAGDYVPYMPSIELYESYAHEWTLEEVIEETRNFARQLSEVQNA